MTLIGIRVHEDSADVVVDTWGYNGNITRIGRFSKVHTLPHLDAALVSSGDSVASAHWSTDVAQLAMHAESLDDVIDHAPAALRALHQELDRHLPERDSPRLTTFLVGYSPRAERFTATAFVDEHEHWAPLDVSSFHVQPSPTTYRLSDVEHLQLRHQLVQVNGEPAEEVDAVLGLWRERAELLPDDDPTWSSMAYTAFLTRALSALGGGLKTLVGGEIWRTTLRRGEVSQRRISQLPEEGPLMWKLFEGSAHPLGQMGLCACGSGRLFRMCCLLPHLDEPCGCRSGETLRDCCAVPDTVEGLQQAAAVTAARR